MSFVLKETSTKAPRLSQRKSKGIIRVAGLVCFLKGLEIKKKEKTPGDVFSWLT
jgi:hypothetical protein